MQVKVIKINDVVANLLPLGVKYKGLHVGIVCKIKCANGPKKVASRGSQRLIPSQHKQVQPFGIRVTNNEVVQLFYRRRYGGQLSFL